MNTEKENSPSIKLRPVEEGDIPQLYEMLKEMYDIPHASVNERPLVPYESSKKFVMRYFHDNENHEIDNWYMVVDDDKKILGSVKISKKNYISYQILRQYQNMGLGSKAVKMLMELHPRERYFATINEKNESSLKLVKKFGFKPKATVFEKIGEK